jgi:hypothetical protein
MKSKNQVERQATDAKKQYRTPELLFHGDVTQLTKGTLGSLGDGSANKSRSCWIAEALYGIDAPRTRLVRAWLAECYEQRVSWALVIVPLYSRFGQRVAGSVRRHSSLRQLFRPIFDYAVRRAHRNFAVRAIAINQAA